MHPESKKTFKFEQNLTRYGKMAAAVAAAAAPAQATLVVRDPADVTTPVNGWVTFSMTTGEANVFPPSVLAGADFWMNQWTTSYNSHATYGRGLQFSRFGGNQPNGGFLVGPGGYVARLAAGVTVGPAGTFSNVNYNMAFTSMGAPASGPLWNGLGQGYLGVQFEIGGQTHYGWADVTVNSDYTGTLHRWAYDDAADTPVVTGFTGSEVPEPGSMSLMILGAAGLAAYRRLRKRKAA